MFAITSEIPSPASRTAKPGATPLLVVEAPPILTSAHRTGPMLRDPKLREHSAPTPLRPFAQRSFMQHVYFACFQQPRLYPLIRARFIAYADHAASQFGL